METKNRWAELIQLKKFEEGKAALSLYHSPDDIKNLRAKSILAALQEQSPTLATVKKYHDEMTMRASIIFLLYEVRDYFNVTNGLTDQQIELISELIFDDFHYLKLSELRFVFRCKMKAGFKKPGDKLYNRLDGEIIFIWLNEYLEERMLLTQQVSQAYAKEEKDAEFVSTETIRQFRKVLERQERKKKELKAIETRLRVAYRTLEAVCSKNDIDTIIASKALEEMFRASYRSDVRNERFTYELYKAMKSAEFLYQLNQWDEFLSTKNLIFVKDDDIEI